MDGSKQGQLAALHGAALHRESLLPTTSHYFPLGILPTISYYLLLPPTTSYYFLLLTATYCYLLLNCLTCTVQRCIEIASGPSLDRSTLGRVLCLSASCATASAASSTTSLPL